MLISAPTPLYAQNLLSGLLGNNLGVSVDSGLLDISVLGQSANSDVSLLSLDVLSNDAILGVGLSGQDILLLGAPSQQFMPMEALMPLLESIGSDQTSVIEFLADSALTGDVEPPVLTVSLPGATVGGDNQNPTVNTAEDRNDPERANSASNAEFITLTGHCPDKDGDAVCDSVDQCPDSPAKAIVLPSGCHFSADKPLELHGVEFAIDTARLTAESVGILKRAAAILKNLPNGRVEVAGHTDDTADSAYNSVLSRKRAEAVKAFLIKEGVPALRLVAKGYGEREPKASIRGLSGSALAAARAENRRVELRLIR